MGDDYVCAVPEERKDIGNDLIDGGGAGNVGGQDAGYLLNANGEGAAGVDAGRVVFARAVLLKAHGCELDNGIALWIESGSLQVEGDERTGGHSQGAAGGVLVRAKFGGLRLLLFCAGAECDGAGRPGDVAGIEPGDLPQSKDLVELSQRRNAVGGHDDGEPAQAG